MRSSALVTVALAVILLGSCGQADKPSALFASEENATPNTGGAKSPLPGAFSDRIAVKEGGDRNHPIISLLNIRTHLIYGQYQWNENGVPAGPLWVRVDLKQQLISVFRGGHEIGTAVILYGADKKPTPLGTFPILARFKDHRSGPYGAPMPYTLRLTSDGVSIHGSNVQWGVATHGCVGIPLEFAQRLFEQARVGDQVIITNTARRLNS